MNDWTWIDRDGAVAVRCNALDGGTPFGHAFSSRQGDRGGLVAAASMAGAEVVEVRQVHGAEIVNAAAVGPDTEADGIVVRAGSRAAAAIRTADCVPIVLVDSAGRAAAAVHAGWRGTAAGIAGAAVAHLAALGSDPRDLRAALGPAIGVCCYRVGADVATAVLVASGNRRGIVVRDADGVRVDLRAALAAQLVTAGVAPSAVRAAPWCTACDPERFHSYRRDGAAAGRMVAVVGYARRP